MIKLRTLVILAGVSGFCVMLVLITSFLASGRPESGKLNADTRSQLTADYASDPGPPAEPLSPIKPEIIESAGQDEAQLAKTELRIGSSSAPAGAAPAYPRLDDFDPQHGSTTTSAVTTAAVAPPKRGPKTNVASTAASSKPSRTKALPTPTQPSYVRLALISCSLQSLWRSVNSLTDTQILFRNKTSQPIKIWELNFSGNQDYKGDVDPGQQLLVDTYVSHPWLVTDSDGNCRGVYSPRNLAGLVVIE